MMESGCCVYILMNNSGVLYIGSTNNLVRRLSEHNLDSRRGFTNKYKVRKLVYFEVYEKLNRARDRERQLKNWHREWKLNLIARINPDFEELVI